MKVINIDLTGLVLGRAASYIAQKLMAGYTVNAYNAEKLIVTGNLKDIIEKYTERLNYAGKGNPEKAPKYPRLPHLLFKRAVKNMLPHKKTTGREALRRLKVYISSPESKVKLETIDVAKLKRGIKYEELGKISKMLGAKW